MIFVYYNTLTYIMCTCILISYWLIILLLCVTFMLNNHSMRVVHILINLLGCAFGLGAGFRGEISDRSRDHDEFCLFIFKNKRVQLIPLICPWSNSFSGILSIKKKHSDYIAGDLTPHSTPIAKPLSLDFD